MRKLWVVFLFASTLFGGPVVGSSGNVLPKGKFMTEYHLSLSQDIAGKLELYYGYHSRATAKIKIEHMVYDTSFTPEISKLTIDTKINILTMPKFSVFIGTSLKEFAPYGGFLLSFVPTRLGIHLSAYGTTEDPFSGAKASLEYKFLPKINLLLEGVYKSKNKTFNPWLSCQISLPITLEIAGLLDKNNPEAFIGGYVIW